MSGYAGARERFADVMFGSGNHDDAFEVAYSDGYEAGRASGSPQTITTAEERDALDALRYWSSHLKGLRDRESQWFGTVIERILDGKADPRPTDSPGGTP